MELEPWLMILAAFLLGAVPFSHLIGKFRGKNLLREGSRNPGATNLYRVCGPWAGLLGLILDIAKGVGAAWWGQSQGLGLESGLAAVLGHTFTPFLAFRGGKGVATAAGAFLVLEPLSLAASFLTFGVVLAASRYVSLASSLAALCLAVGVQWTSESLPSKALVWGLVLLILWKHRANFGRIARGEETRIGS